MKKDKLGIRLFNYRGTPSWVRKLMHWRWDTMDWLKANKNRKKNGSDVFEIPVKGKGSVFFDLPDHRDFISCKIIGYYNFYEHEFLYEILDYLGEDICIFDVGANIGNHTLFFSGNRPGADIFSFEASPAIFRQLERNIRLNGVENVKCLNVGVGDKKGFGKIAYDGAVENNSGATAVCYDKSGTIPLISLDDFVRENQIEHVDFVKIDVEGFEYNVLEGMRELIDRFNPLIWVEILDDNEDKVSKLIRDIGLEYIDDPVFSNSSNYLLKK